MKDEGVDEEAFMTHRRTRSIVWNGLEAEPDGGVALETRTESDLEYLVPGLYPSLLLFNIRKSRPLTFSQTKIKD